MCVHTYTNTHTHTRIISLARPPARPPSLPHSQETYRAVGMSEKHCFLADKQCLSRDKHCVSSKTLFFAWYQGLVRETVFVTDRHCFSSQTLTIERLQSFGRKTLFATWQTLFLESILDIKVETLSAYREVWKPGASTRGWALLLREPVKMRGRTRGLRSSLG